MKAISVENVSKKFILAHDRPKNLADLAQGKLLRRQREEFWALKDVAFDVEQGEALGIIGHNGAGKSTMLKLLTKIMFPTQGRIRTRGRLSALIEVGAGFHPEMSGRENIFLNGSILGMSQKEIASKLDEIVAFAELEKFIDTPVKRYSSGMYARLGFAVAAHVDPEILIVDEVLSVGDLAFQEKCSKRMQELRESSRTVLLVSHNMSTIVSLCKRVILLENGCVKMIGDAQTAVKAYRESLATRATGTLYNPAAQSDLSSARAVPLTITDIEMLGKGSEWTMRACDPLRLRLRYSAAGDIPAPRIGVHVLDKNGRVLAHFSNAAKHTPPDLVGQGACNLSIDSLPLMPGTYLLVAKASDKYGAVIYDSGITSRELVILPPTDAPERGVMRSGLLWIDSDWDYPDGAGQ